MDCPYISIHGKFVTSQTASFSRVDINLQQVVYVYVATIFVYIMFFCNQANIDTTKELMKGVVSSVFNENNDLIILWYNQLIL